MKLLRPYVSVKRDFLNFSLFYVLKKLSKILNSLCACSDLYAHAEHMGQELKRMLSVCVSTVTDAHSDHMHQFR
jgi:hypothetical protein